MSDDERREPCPECEEGELVQAGPMEWDTGHIPIICSARCGFWA
jgi:hypothetical protein